MVISILRLCVTDEGFVARELVEEESTFFSLDRMIFCCAISRIGTLRLGRENCVRINACVAVVVVVVMLLLLLLLMLLFCCGCYCNVATSVVVAVVVVMLCCYVITFNPTELAT